MPDPAAATADDRDLARAGYRPQFRRGLGSFTAFAAGFSYLSILTGIVQIFHLGYREAGPAFVWTWPVVFAGQFTLALCFAELARRYPFCGGIYAWSRRAGSPFVGWLTGWVYLASLVVTLAAVALAWQIVLPNIWAGFQVVEYFRPERGDPRGRPHRHQHPPQRRRHPLAGGDHECRRGGRVAGRGPAGRPARGPRRPRAGGRVRGVRRWPDRRVRLAWPVPGGGRDGRLRHVRVRHGRDAGRGDGPPAPPGPAGHPPGPDGRGGPRRPAARRARSPRPRTSPTRCSPATPAGCRT